MDDLKLERDEEGKTYYVTTSKRKERIKIYIPPFDPFGFWKIAYERDVAPIPELSGNYTNYTIAFKAVKNWLETQKPSDAAKHDEWFGTEKAPPVKRKNRVASKDSTNSS